jgi:hypothetical protein
MSWIGAGLHIAAGSNCYPLSVASVMCHSANNVHTNGILRVADYKTIGCYWVVCISVCVPGTLVPARVWASVSWP